MFKELNHKAFLVGGAVRNFYMGKKAKDLDFVIENTTEEEFLAVFPNAEKVGKDFPVFLINGHECALARTERSTGNGYTDFEFTVGVSIEDDLSRRDLKLNSIAIGYKTDKLVDPFHGVTDIHNRIISTHNIKAFIEDPLRIYRAIRFACEFDFEIEEQTRQLIKESINKLQFINTERVQIELQKVYDRCDNPSVFFRILDSVDGLGIHFKELEISKTILTGKPEHHPEIWNSEHLFNSFDNAKKNGYSYDVAIAALVHDLGKIESPNPPSHVMHECHIEVLDAFFERHRFSTHIMELSKVVFKHHMKIHYLSVMKDIKKIRFVRRIPRYLREEYIQACNCDAPLSEIQLDIFKKVCEAIDTATKGKKADIEAFVKTHKTKEAIDNFINNIILNKYKEIK